MTLKELAQVQDLTLDISFCKGEWIAKLLLCENGGRPVEGRGDTASYAVDELANSISGCSITVNPHNAPREFFCPYSIETGDTLD